MSDAQHGTRDPFEYLRRYWPQVRLVTKRLTGGRHGLTEWLPRGEVRITLAEELTDAERRETACHEMLHVERGAPDDWNRPAEEGAVTKQTARWLLPNARVVKEAIAKLGLRGAARVFRLPVRVLVTRMRGLTAHEAFGIYEKQED